MDGWAQATADSQRRRGGEEEVGRGEKTGGKTDKITKLQKWKEAEGLKDRGKG